MAHCRPVALFLSASFWLPRFRCCWRGCCCSFWVSSAWHVACMHRLPHTHTHTEAHDDVITQGCCCLAASTRLCSVCACVCVYFCLRFCFLTNTNGSEASLLPSACWHRVLLLARILCNAPLMNAPREALATPRSPDSCLRCDKKRTSRMATTTARKEKNEREPIEKP